MAFEIDIFALLRYILKRIWLPILCAIIGFGGMYYRAEYMMPNTYTASSTIYVYNGNPNLVNYQYTNTGELSTAVMLADTYAVVIRSNKVMDAVAERLDKDLEPSYIASTISMGSVNKTGVVRVECTTTDAQLSMDICNAVVDIAPTEIIRVVGAGSVEVIDYADLPLFPNSHQSMRNGAIGALVGVVLACGILFVFFILDRSVKNSKEITDAYPNLPLLSTIPKQGNKDESSAYVIDKDSPSQLLASYGKLRMNLSFSMVDKSKIIVVSSAIPGENKSTVSANLAVAFAMDGKRVLLIDADLRKPRQAKLFQLHDVKKGLTDMLLEGVERYDYICRDVRPNLDILPAGTVPPNPAELLNSEEMRSFLKNFEYEYDLIILDTPPINVVTDALLFSNMNVGLLFVIRCNYSDHREIKKALSSAEYINMNMLGTVMTFATRASDGYYGYRYYHYKHYYGHYYGSYDKDKGDKRDKRDAASEGKSK